MIPRVIGTNNKKLLDWAGPFSNSRSARASSPSSPAEWMKIFKSSRERVNKKCSGVYAIVCTVYSEQWEVEVLFFLWAGQKNQANAKLMHMVALRTLSPLALSHLWIAVRAIPWVD